MTIHRLTTQHVKKLQKIDRKGNSLCAEEQCSSVGEILTLDCSWTKETRISRYFGFFFNNLEPSVSIIS